MATSVDSARVGRRLSVMDSSICVAVMTGFALQVCLPHQLFLHDGDLLDGNLHPEIPPGDHDSVGDLQNFIDTIQSPRPLDLGDDERMVIQIGSRFTDGGNVCGPLDKGLTDRVETLLLGELQPPVILLGEGSNAEVDAGKVQPFPGAKFASDEDAAPDVCPVHLHDLKLDETVVQVQPIPGLHRLRQAGEADGDPARVTNDVVRR